MATGGLLGNEDVVVGLPLVVGDLPEAETRVVLPVLERAPDLVLFRVRCEWRKFPYSLVCKTLFDEKAIHDLWEGV